MSDPIYLRERADISYRLKRLSALCCVADTVKAQERAHAVEPLSRYFALFLGVYFVYLHTVESERVLDARWTDDQGVNRRAPSPWTVVAGVAVLLGACASSLSDVAYVVAA